MRHDDNLPIAERLAKALAIRDGCPWECTAAYTEGPNKPSTRYQYVTDCEVLARAYLDLIHARPFDEWHEDIGNVLWWRLPVCEPPYVGTPLDSNWDEEDEERMFWTPLVCPPDEERV